MNKEVTKQKNDDRQKSKIENGVDVLAEKMNRNRQRLYWRKGSEPINNKDFRNPIRN